MLLRRSTLLSLLIASCTPDAPPPSASVASVEPWSTKLFVSVDGERRFGRFSALGSVTTDNSRFWLCYAPEKPLEPATHTVCLVGLARDIPLAGEHGRDPEECLDGTHGYFELDAEEARAVAELTELEIGMRTDPLVALEARVEPTAKLFEVGWPVSAELTLINHGSEPLALAYWPTQPMRSEHIEVWIEPAVARRPAPESVRAALRGWVTLQPGQVNWSSISLTNRFALDTPGEYHVTVGVDYDLLSPRSRYDESLFCPVTAKHESLPVRATAAFSLSPLTTPLPEQFSVDFACLTSVSLDNSLFRLCISHAQVQRPAVAAALEVNGIREPELSTGMRHSRDGWPDHHVFLVEANEANSLATVLGITRVLRPASGRKISGRLSFGATSQRGVEDLRLQLHLRNDGSERVDLNWSAWDPCGYRFEAEPPLPSRSPPAQRTSWAQRDTRCDSCVTLDPGEEHVVIVKLDTESFDLSRVGRHEITLDFSLKAPPDAIPAHAPCRIVAEELIVRASGRLVLD